MLRVALQRSHANIRGGPRKINLGFRRVAAVRRAAISQPGSPAGNAALKTHAFQILRGTTTQGGEAATKARAERNRRDAIHAKLCRTVFFSVSVASLRLVCCPKNLRRPRLRLECGHFSLALTHTGKGQATGLCGGGNTPHIWMFAALNRGGNERPRSPLGIFRRVVHIFETYVNLRFRQWGSAS